MPAVFAAGKESRLFPCERPAFLHEKGLEKMPNLRIAVDAFGGDDAPDVVLAGVDEALAAREGFEVVLCGLPETVEPFAASRPRVTPRSCSQTVEMGEHGARAVRKKRDSSIVVGCKLVKEGDAQGFFSAGSTGACMAAATLFMGRLPHVKRPAIATVIPSPAGKCVMCDVGANADCKPEYLVQFALMGAAYARTVLGVSSPRIGLLNIGAEEEKGSEFAQTCHKLLKEQVVGFMGNAEGRDVALGRFDVIVTDGFTGNVALKAFEGVGKALFSAFKDVMTDTVKHKLGALLVRDGLMDLKASVSPDEYGGAQLLGVKGVCLIGHGSANAHAIASGVLATVDAAASDMPRRISQEIASHAAALATAKNDGGDGDEDGGGASGAADIAAPAADGEGE